MCFFKSQIVDYAKDISVLKKQSHYVVVVVRNWLITRFNITISTQVTVVNSTTGNLEYSSFIGVTVSSLIQLVLVLVLLRGYMFLLLYYRDIIYNFFIRVFATHHSEKVKEVLLESRIVVHVYMVGLLVEMAVVTIIKSLFFLL